MKNFLKALMPPPAVPRRPKPEAQVKISTLRRFWEALKPPPAVHQPARVISPEERSRRRRMVAITVAVFLLSGAGWGGYVYVSSAPQRSAATLQEGMRLVAAGDFKTAVARFTRAAEISPNNQNTAYYQRGLAHQNLGEQDLARADFELAVTADPGMAPAHVALGSLYRQRGDNQRAVIEFSLAINLDSDMDAYYQRGQVYETLGEHQKAIDDYNVGISKMRDAPYVYLARALSRDQLGDHDGAEEDRKVANQLQNH